jgi:hypothetical protein
MSTEHPYDPNTPQYDWVVQDLEAAFNNKDVTPWIVFLGHRPMVSVFCLFVYVYLFVCLFVVCLFVCLLCKIWNLLLIIRCHSFDCLF